ncbi:MAG: hypothetical protein H0V46_00305 [Sphingomonas sp.]|nr:hypothetical protein [Sphingomonas sp.]
MFSGLPNGDGGRALKHPPRFATLSKDFKAQSFFINIAETNLDRPARPLRLWVVHLKFSALKAAASRFSLRH